MSHTHWCYMLQATDVIGVRLDIFRKSISSKTSFSNKINKAMQPFPKDT